MGNLCSRPWTQIQSPRSVPDPSLASAAVLPPSPSSHLNPKDFMVTSVKDMTVVRGPGQVAGQQFIIDTVDNCNIFLFDYSAQVTVDFATNCRIFIGPCESSVFLRDCRSCKVVVACQQFRTRDCSDLDLSLFCVTQPSIEASNRLTLSCFQASYFSLAEQFRAANICIWDNSWWRIHDFNETEDEQHWSLCPPSHDGDDFLGINPSTVCPDIRFEETQLPSPVPLTAGSVRGVAQKTWFVLVVDNADHTAMGVIQELTRTSAYKLLETRQARLSHTQAELLLMHNNGGKDLSPAIRLKAETQPIVGLLFAGDEHPQVHREGVLVATDLSTSQHMASCFLQQFRPIV